MTQLLATVLPSIILVYFFVTQDRFPEPKKIIIITFVLGILITIPAGFLNSYLIDYFYYNFRFHNYYNEIETFFVGPFTEEILKFCIIFFYCSRLDDFDEPMDGLVYGATAALGFAMAENFDYVYNASDFNSTWQDVAWIRALSTAPMHAACGAMIGFAVSYYHFYNKKLIFLIIGLLIAIFFHFLFNYGFFDLIVIVQLIILFFLFRHLKKKQAIVSKVWQT
jgi:RsiW-degrading membrane proteinase PrsW (M82 family)|tara:strand:- start:282 stop:950 length:669 start_codon:yes stop_codon:yes gene_type:complete